MGTKANFTRNDVRLYLESFCEAVVKRQIRYLQYLGEMCLTEARNNKGYMMQTGALTSSTGYQVFVDSGAESEAAARGVKTGQTLAEQIGKDTKGVALVVVAGMNYAAYVEARGYNVLSSAEHLAERELPRMLEKLITGVKRAAD